MHYFLRRIKFITTFFTNSPFQLVIAIGTKYKTARENLNNSKPLTIPNLY